MIEDKKVNHDTKVKQFHTYASLGMKGDTGDPGVRGSRGLVGNKRCSYTHTYVYVFTYP